jgi:DNA polymerase IV
VKDRRRTILHVDLDPFFVGVERSLDPSLRGRALVVGGGERSGFVVAASGEAKAAGVRPGQTLAAAREQCPDAVIRPGDLDAYGQVSEQVSSVLLSACRRVERPSADEAYLDLTPDSPGAPAPVPIVEGLKDELHRRLSLDASFGLASSRLAARIASSWAKPRGFLLVLPGYEGSFLGRQPLSALEDLPPHLATGLERAGMTTLGQIAAADEKTLIEAVGPVAAPRLRLAARGEDEEPIAVAAPPAWVQEEVTIRDRRTDRTALEDVLEGIVRRACRRLRPFDLRAGLLTVEVRRPNDDLRRSESFSPPRADEETISLRARELAEPLLEPAGTVRSLLVRLGRLSPPVPQSSLFPDLPRPASR